MESGPGKSLPADSGLPPNLTRPAETPAIAAIPTPIFPRKLRRLSPPLFSSDFLLNTVNSGLFLRAVCTNEPSPLGLDYRNNFDIIAVRTALRITSVRFRLGQSLSSPFWPLPDPSLPNSWFPCPRDKSGWCWPGRGFEWGCGGRESGSRNLRR